MNKSNIIKNAIAPYSDYCDGYGNLGSSGNSYFLGMHLAVGIDKMKFGHPGSKLLDEVNAFDIAETIGPYIGQLNMSIVSSFCGPQGLIWGYDIAKHPVLDSKKEIFVTDISFLNHRVPVYNGDFLIESLEKIFGTVDDKKFHLRPGAHVPFASKNIKISEPGKIYAAIGIGIPKDREKNACLLMEDVGRIVDSDIRSSVLNIKNQLAKSIIQVGSNQRVEYKEIYVIVKFGEIGENEVGCALIAAPYFTIAQNALPMLIDGVIDYAMLTEGNLNDWGKTIFKDGYTRIELVQ